MANRYLEKIAGRELAVHSKIIDGATRTVRSSIDRTWQAKQFAKSVAKNAVKKHGLKAGIGAATAAAITHAVSGKSPRGHTAHAGKGMISPAWQESAIAKEHGKKLQGSKIMSHLGGVGSAAVGGVSGHFKGLGAGILAGGLAGTALAAKNAKPLGRAAFFGAAGGALVGKTLGKIYGSTSALKERADRLHKKYSEDK